LLGSDAIPRTVDHTVAAERGEGHLHEVPVARRRARGVPRIAARAAARRRPARLPLTDRRLAGVAAHGAVPGEAERVAHARPVAVAEDLRRAGRLVDDRLARGAGRVDDPRIGEA